MVFAFSANGQIEEMQSLSKALTENRASLDEMKLGDEAHSGMVISKLGDSVVEEGGGTYDGLVFKAPEKLRERDFIWYFNAPEGWANWYILPLGDEPKQGFKNWINADKVYAEFDRVGEADRFRALQTLDGSYFEAGKEYVLWFRKTDGAEPGELRLCAAFADPGKKAEWDHISLEGALKLKPQPAEEQVKALGSLGGRILLDREFFGRAYAEGRIDSLFFSLREQKQMEGGFFIQIKTSTPPCKTNPKLADIMAKYGEPDFIRSTKEEELRRPSEVEKDDEEPDDEEPTVTYFYDHFGFVVDEGDADRVVRFVEVQANDFSALRPKGEDRATFGQLAFENLTVFHFDGEEVGRIYRFDEDGKEPLVIKAPPERAYLNGKTSLTYRGDGNWTMAVFSDAGDKDYVKRYEGHRLNGVTEVFHKNGQLRFSFSYKDGVPDGKFTEFDEAGKMVREVVYRDGELEK